MTLHRRLHQQRLQIQRKVGDGALISGLGKLGANLVDKRRLEQAAPCILRRGPHKGHRSRVKTQHLTVDGRQRRAVLDLHTDGQKILLLAAIDSQNLMILQLMERRGKIVIVAVDAVLLRGRGRDKAALTQHQLAQRFADGRIVTDPFGHDVAGALQGLRNISDALFPVHIINGRLLRQRAGALLGKEQLRQRLQALLPGDGGPGTALGLIGAVQILNLGQGGSAVNGGSQFLRQLALLGNGMLHRLAAVGHIAQILQAVGQIAQRGVVHGAVQLLTVAGDERYGIALVQKRDHILHIVEGLVEFGGKPFGNGLHSPFPFPGNKGGRSCGHLCSVIRLLTVTYDRAFSLRISARS